MSQASFDLSPVLAAIGTQAVPIVVCRYDSGGENQYTILPNVRCLRIDYREGAEPPLARFQYYMDDLLAASLDWPSQFEQLWPIDAQGDYVVMTDDRLVVLTQDPEGNPVVLFDGFAQIPQADLSAQTQSVTFVAQGVAVRLWDLPIFGRTQRSAADADDTSGVSDIFVQLPCRFNPSDTSIGVQGGYIGNCVGSGFFTEDEDSGNVYPVFVDPLREELSTDDTTYWFISDAISYLIAIEPSPQDAAGNPYIVYPTIESLADLLGTYAPPDNGPLNAGDAEMTNCKIRDYDASNKAVPDVFSELLRYCGFVMVFTTTTDSEGTPINSLKIVRKDALAATTPKLLYLAAAGPPSLDLAANNVTAIHLARDLNQVVNQWTVETALKQIEITVYLAPGFTPNAGDIVDRTPFFKNNLRTATGDQRRMYRWWIADECADGHYNMLTSTWVTDEALDLSPIFPANDAGGATYVDRYRPGSQTLISKDANGKPLKAVLEVFKGGYSEDPALETDPDQTGWITIPHGHGWRLLDDRLGIEVTENDPDGWATGAVKPIAGGAARTEIRALTWTATPTQDTAFELRLTTVIDADYQMEISAAKRTASPTRFARERCADGKDHFQYCTIAPNSLNYATQTDINGDSGDNTNPLVMRDDTKAATTHAEQLRSAHEFPTLAGSATLPFITDYYQIGDRVQIIQGRNANLQINVGVDQGETPSYPWITAFAWDFQGDKQQTILQFSDRRAEPQGV
jgi:hypothetical protein